MIDLTSASLPSVLPQRLSVEGDFLISTPLDSSDEKEKKDVTAYFLRFFKKKFSQETAISPQALKLTDQYLARMGALGKEPISKELADLERYALASHLRLNDLKATDTLKKRCQEHDVRHFYSRWMAYQVEQGGADDLFFREPDLVDFVFENHLHRYIRYPSYDHHIICGDDGRAQLLQDGKYESWTQIKRSKTQFIDSQGSPSYFQDGLTTQKGLKCLYKLENPKEQSQLQIVVSMINSDYHCLQRPCQGGDHSFCRLILGKEMKDRAGEVYSFGFLPKKVLTEDSKADSKVSVGETSAENDEQANIATVNFTLLNSIEGCFFAPDFIEFSNHPLRVGTCDLLPGQGEQLFEALKVEHQHSRAFNALHDNCHANLLSFLHEQGILLDLDVYEPLSSILYRIFLPECIQSGLNFVGSYVPECLQKIYRVSLDFFTSLLILTPLGAWFCAENVEKAVFERVLDLIDPEKAYISTAAKIIQWQDLHDPHTTRFSCGEEEEQSCC